MRRRHRLHGLGEPITLAAIPWLWVAGGALFAKWFTAPRDTLTPESIERAQVLRDYLDASRNSWFTQAQTAWGTIGVDESALDEFIAKNADLMNPALYKSGKAPSAKELKDELRAVVAVAKAQGAGSFGEYAIYARTLQGLR